MPNYRFYFITSEGRIDGPAQLVVCATDEEAIRKAKALKSSRQIEVWKRAELIARIDAYQPGWFN